MPKDTKMQSLHAETGFDEELRNVAAYAARSLGFYIIALSMHNQDAACQYILYAAFTWLVG